MRILTVEDEKKVADFLNRGLSEDGYKVDLARTGADGLAMAVSGAYDLMILDLMLPDTDGIMLCRRLRQQGVTTPVLMLTARDAVEDRVAGLDAGADDYLVKPFAFEELLARIRVLLRRQMQTRTNLLCIADLELDTLSRSVRRGDRTIDLTPREYALLEYMMRRPGRVLSRTVLTEQVWEYDFASGTNVVDVYINYLRKKIDRDADRPLIHTIRGIGYVIRDGGGV